MQNYRDNFHIYDENALLKLAIISVIGDREEQQDCVGYELKPDDGLVVVCDGMGGHAGGKLASSIAVDMLIKRYLSEYPASNIKAMLIETVEEIDQRIVSIEDDEGKRLQAGTTAVIVSIRGKTLNWVSVGDSRIYIFRDGELVQVTKDHTYQSVLDEKRSKGLIDDVSYQLESQQGEVLISFLGANGLRKIDTNENPFSVLKGDKILLMSDGLYKLISDDVIQRILSNFNNIDDALNALEIKVKKIAKKFDVSRDNMTVALIEIK